MNRRTRRAINLFANMLEEASERLVTWLRAKAERKFRQRPLVFPTSFELMMADLLRAPIRQQVQQILKMPSILDEVHIVGETVKVRFPSIYDE